MSLSWTASVIMVQILSMYKLLYQYRIFIVKYSLSSKHRFDKYFQTHKSAACVPRFLCEECTVLVDVVEEKEHSVGYVF